MISTMESWSSRGSFEFRKIESAGATEFCLPTAMRARAAASLTGIDTAESSTFTARASICFCTTASIFPSVSQRAMSGRANEAVEGSASRLRRESLTSLPSAGCAWLFAMIEERIAVLISSADRGALATATRSVPAAAEGSGLSTAGRILTTSGLSFFACGEASATETTSISLPLEAAIRAERVHLSSAFANSDTSDPTPSSPLNFA